MAAPIRVGGAHLCEARHVCAFFHSVDDQYAATLPFIGEGLVNGDRAVHIVNPVLRAEHERRMTLHGIDTAAARKKGQLDVLDWSDTFFAEGDFKPERMIGQLEAVLAAGRDRGYPLTRFVAHAEWGLDPRASVQDLLDFESRVNAMWPSSSDAVICCYDLNRFSGDVVIEALRTHPMVIIGGILQENPFFMRPIRRDEVLSHLSAR